MHGPEPREKLSQKCFISQEASNEPPRAPRQCMAYGVPHGPQEMRARILLVQNYQRHRPDTANPLSLSYTYTPGIVRYFRFHANEPRAPRNSYQVCTRTTFDNDVTTIMELLPDHCCPAPFLPLPGRLLAAPPQQTTPHTCRTPWPPKAR